MRIRRIFGWSLPWPYHLASASESLMLRGLTAARC